jgi:hypothetical protein
VEGIAVAFPSSIVVLASYASIDNIRAIFLLPLSSVAPCLFADVD